MKKKTGKEKEYENSKEQNEIENLLEQKERETKALKHLINVLGKMEPGPDDPMEER